ncbi:MAG: hypothetical protein U1F43_21210 [Myxococcota bacterium]
MTAAALVSFRAAADGNPSTDDLPRLMPFAGTLEKGGVGYSGQVDMTFVVYDSATGTTPLWSETQTVTVYRGAFSVLLGSKAGTAALSAAVESAASLWVGASLTTSSGTVVLNGRKRIVPVPYAMLTTAATGVSAGGQLVLESTVAMASDGASGPLTITDSNGDRLTLDGNDIDSQNELWLDKENTKAVFVGGDVTVGGDTISFSSSKDTLVHDSGDSLHFDALPGPDLGTVERTEFQNPVTVNGDVTGLQTTFTQDNDGGTGDCTDYDLQANDGSDLLYYFCGGGRVWVGGKFQGIVGNNAKAIQVMRCCAPKVTVQ